MPTSPTPQRTDFTLDILGRYICNGLDEALRSADQNIRPDARPFNVLILGGGSFGLALAQHLFNVDKAHTKRILVLEGGPFALSEHVQNMPMQGLNPASATTIDPGTARNEVWGLPWRSSVAFPGLAYCIGGRSVFYGGWAPQLLDTNTDVEMRHALWPQAVRDDLNNTYFAAASEQTGVDVANEFIFGDLQNALRQQLFDGVNGGSVHNAIPLADLPSSPMVPPGTSSVSDLRGILGLNGATGGPTNTVDLLNMAKLEAPLAVQGRAPRSGFFPLNKFSSVPLGMTASRSAWAESGGDDVRRRLMIVPNCHVQRLVTSTDSAGNVQVTRVLTNQGPIPVPGDGVVVLAHHEAGTLAMGENPASSVTNSDLRFHAVTNAYALGPAVLPTTGSPNPMLTGVALARRLAEKLVRPPAPPQADPGFTLLFDGVSTNGWRMSTITNQPGRDFPGQFVISNGTLVGMPGTDLGLLWSTTPTPADFLLKLEWLSTNITDNSGVFIRFPNPDSKRYSNTAWVGVDYGFEIQIDQRAMPDGNPIHLTGAVYSFAGPNSPNTLPVKPLGEWNLFEIQVQGQHYQISLNGQLITNFTFTVGGDAAHPDRALPSSAQVPRFIGLQTHTGNVAFRNIQIKDLTAAATRATKKATTAVPA